MDIAPEVAELERYALSANVPITKALKHAHVAPSTYWRWRAGTVEPLTKTVRRVRAAIETLEACA